MSESRRAIQLLLTGSDAHAGKPSEVTLWRWTEDRMTRLASTDLVSPSWLVTHPRLPVAYVTEESSPGYISVLSFAARGSLAPRQRIDSQGGLPCHLAVDASGSQLAVSNYEDGTVAIWRLDNDGMPSELRGVWSLTGSGPVASRQDRSHAHWSEFRNADLFVIDLGGDAIHRIDRAGVIEEVMRFSPGFGPRHAEWLSEGRLLVVGELASELALVNTEAPNDWFVITTACTSALGDAQPSGIATDSVKAVYVANRGLGTLSKFVVEADHIAQHGEVALADRFPRSVTVMGGYAFVCLQDCGMISAYSGDLGQTRVSAKARRVSDLKPIPARVVASLGWQ